MIDPVAAVFPWVEVIGTGTAGVGLAMCWMFLKHLRDLRMADEKEAARKDETVKDVTAHFSQTVRDVSNDAKQALMTVHETTQTLLADNRDREAKLHEVIRSRGQ